MANSGDGIFLYTTLRATGGFLVAPSPEPQKWAAFPPPLFQTAPPVHPAVTNPANPRSRSSTDKQIRLQRPLSSQALPRIPGLPPNRIARERSERVRPPPPAAKLETTHARATQVPYGREDPPAPSLHQKSSPYPSAPRRLRWSPPSPS